MVANGGGSRPVASRPRHRVASGTLLGTWPAVKGARVAPPDRRRRHPSAATRGGTRVTGDVAGGPHARPPTAAAAAVTAAVAAEATVAADAPGLVRLRQLLAPLRHLVDDDHGDVGDGDAGGEADGGGVGGGSGGTPPAAPSAGGGGGDAAGGGGGGGGGDGTPNAISVLTIHAAKGCEWPAVLLPGLDDADWLAGWQFDEEECRRHIYVALTRGEERVVMGHPQERFTGRDARRWEGRGGWRTA